MPANSFADCLTSVRACVEWGDYSARVVACWSWLLALLLFGIIADLMITLVMDARLFRPYALQQEHEFHVRGLEFKLLDGAREVAGDATQNNAEYSDCAQAWDHYVGATRFAEMRRMIFQTPIRETVSQLVRVGSMVLVAWWVGVAIYVAFAPEWAGISPFGTYGALAFAALSAVDALRGWMKGRSDS